jgi:hypothetical protein
MNEGAKNVICDLETGLQKRKLEVILYTSNEFRSTVTTRITPNVIIYLDISPSAAFLLPADKQCALPTRVLWHQGYLNVRYDLAVQT